MPRPLKQGLDYFSHDTDAAGDPKIQTLMAMHGTAGYSFYFIMLEKVFRTEKGQLTCGKPTEKAGLARLMCISLKQFDAILETALDIGCFDKETYNEHKAVTSNGIRKRIDTILTIRDKERKRKENIKEEKETINRNRNRKLPPENLRKTPGKPTENSGNGSNSHSKPNKTKEFLAKYCTSFKEIYKLNPVITAKDSGIAKRLCEIPNIDVVMERFFLSRDKFIVQNRHGLNIIESQINKLLVGESGKFDGINTWLQEKGVEHEG